MKNFAIITNDNIVENIVVSEEANAVQLIFGSSRTIVEESDSTGTPYIGAEYRADVNKFIPVQVYESWSFDEESWQWIAPVARPADNKFYYWKESGLNWIEFNPEQGASD